MLHSAVFLWGLTAILGKLISYGSLELVWHRVLIAGPAYLLVPGTVSQLRACTWKAIFKLSGIGCLLAGYWLIFYGSIKLGDSASITLATSSLSALFSALFQPLLMGSKWERRDLLLGVVVLLGTLMIVYSLPSTPTSNDAHPRAAALLGCFASFVGTFLTIFNKLCIDDASPLALNCIELSAGALLLTLVVAATRDAETKLYPDAGKDVLALVVLALACTTLTQWLATSSLKHLSVFTSVLAYNLEPVYGILLGGLIFHENKDLNAWFYVGATVVVGAVFVGPLWDFLRTTSDEIEAGAGAHETPPVEEEGGDEDEEGLPLVAIRQPSSAAL